MKHFINVELENFFLGNVLILRLVICFVSAWGRHTILLVMQNVILTFFYQPTHPPQKILNAEHGKLFRNTNPLVIRDTVKILCFWIVKDKR